MTWKTGTEDADGRLFAPSAERNRAPILDVLRTVLPPTGTVLEVGSGSGQHVAFFASALHDLEWQPSEADVQLHRSIRLWVRDAHVSNVLDPVLLDVAARPWPIRSAQAIVCINVLHVSPQSTAAALFAGARDVLPPSAPVYLYGPYRRAGVLTSAGNEAFDAELKRHDPAWGLRNVEDVQRTAAAFDVLLERIVAMPANNLSLVFRRGSRATPGSLA